ncbi:hypothetical protein ACFYOV_03495 [Streptomyces sp. NPDC005931]|uniref:hypothetical protein n=1 Tax=Streptomyces sp. NPDC005931 TaxID=3364737 RepID=UPI0036B1BB38
MGAARGCAAGAVFALAALVVLLSFGATVEMEAFHGLRENLAPLAVYLLVLAAMAAAGGVALAGRRSYAGRTAAAVLVGLVALRLWTLAPMLHCWSYDSVGRGADGTYTCVDRG